MYRGDFAYDWIRSELKNLGITTFGDLALDDAQMLEERRYRLAVTVTDMTTGQLVRLPWDYRRVYGLDPDDQPVADAVRASMAIPFYFRPVTLTSATGVDIHAGGRWCAVELSHRLLRPARLQTAALAHVRRHRAAESARRQ